MDWILLLLETTPSLHYIAFQFNFPWQSQLREMSSHVDGNLLLPGYGTRVAAEGAATGRSCDGVVEQDPWVAKHCGTSGFGWSGGAIERSGARKQIQPERSGGAALG